MPGDAGYPAYLGTRLAYFYERAGYVQCLGNGAFGSVTIVGAVSPPGGDFSDPVTASTLNIVQVFWGLSKRLARKKHFPSLDWNISFTKYGRALASHYAAQRQGQYTQDVATARRILQEEKKLQEIVQLVGKDSLGEDQKVNLEVARIIREDFLQQNGYSTWDYTCPLVKTMGMLRNFMAFYDLTMKECLAEGDEKMTWGRIVMHLNPPKNEAKGKENDEEKESTVYERLLGMKFLSPSMTEDALDRELKQIGEDVERAFRELRDFL
jgi:V-type H+-transporting ATPase subunit A